MSFSEEDPEFQDTLVMLKELARAGAPMKDMLELVKARVSSKGSPIHGVLAFYRAFDVPLIKASGLANWEGVQEPGLTAEEIEAEVGDFFRSHIRP